jgi:hypothetical protein
MQVAKTVYKLARWMNVRGERGWKDELLSKYIGCTLSISTDISFIYRRDYTKVRT